MRLRVPISSSAPHRPQLRTRARSSSTSGGNGTALRPPTLGARRGRACRRAGRAAARSQSTSGYRALTSSSSLIDALLVHADDERDVVVRAVRAGARAGERALDVGDEADAGLDRGGGRRHADRDRGAAPVEHVERRLQERRVADALERVVDAAGHERTRVRRLRRPGRRTAPARAPRRRCRRRGPRG